MAPKRKRSAGRGLVAQQLKEAMDELAKDGRKKHRKEDESPVGPEELPSDGEPKDPFSMGTAKAPPPVDASEKGSGKDPLESLNKITRPIEDKYFLGQASGANQEPVIDQDSDEDLFRVLGLDQQSFNEEDSIEDASEALKDLYGAGFGELGFRQETLYHQEDTAVATETPSQKISKVKEKFAHAVESKKAGDVVGAFEELEKIIGDFLVLEVPRESDAINVLDLLGDVFFAIDQKIKSATEGEFKEKIKAFANGFAVYLKKDKADTDKVIDYYNSNVDEGVKEGYKQNLYKIRKRLKANDLFVRYFLCANFRYIDKIPDDLMKEILRYLKKVKKVRKFHELENRKAFSYADKIFAQVANLRKDANIVFALVSAACSEGGFKSVAKTLVQIAKPDDSQEKLKDEQSEGNTDIVGEVFDAFRILSKEIKTLRLELKGLDQKIEVDRFEASKLKDQEQSLINLIKKLFEIFPTGMAIKNCLKPISAVSSYGRSKYRCHIDNFGLIEEIDFMASFLRDVKKITLKQSRDVLEALYGALILPDLYAVSKMKSSQLMVVIDIFHLLFDINEEFESKVKENREDERKKKFEKFFSQRDIRNDKNPKNHFQFFYEIFRKVVYIIEQEKSKEKQSEDLNLESLTSFVERASSESNGFFGLDPAIIADAFTGGAFSQWRLQDSLLDLIEATLKSTEESSEKKQNIHIHNLHKAIIDYAISCSSVYFEKKKAGDYEEQSDAVGNPEVKTKEILQKKERVEGVLYSLLDIAYSKELLEYLSDEVEGKINGKDGKERLTIDDVMPENKSVIINCIEKLVKQRERQAWRVNQL